MRIAGLILTAATSLLVFACVSSSHDVVIGTRPPEDVFGTADAGEASAPPVTSADRGMCPSNECPEGRTSCPNTPYPCGVDLMSDDENCGACGVRCPADDAFSARFKGGMRCAAGSCQLVCNNGFADCNGLAEDGCEVNLANDDKNNCGECGNVCDDICVNGQCGCPTGQTLCADGQCHDLDKENGNCGACGNVCPAPPSPSPYPASWRITVECIQGRCNQPKCQTRFMDCNLDFLDSGGDGCETPTTDRNNCGSCGNVCNPGEDCIGGQCFCRCGAICHTAINSDPDNCGACAHKCPGDRRSLDSTIGTDPAHGKPSCEQGACGYTCTPNWGDCDSDIDNGCEANFLSDPLNCGGCGLRCNAAVGQACVDGKCLMKDCGGVQ